MHLEDKKRKNIDGLGKKKIVRKTNRKPRHSLFFIFVKMLLLFAIFFFALFVLRQIFFPPTYISSVAGIVEKENEESKDGQSNHSEKPEIIVKPKLDQERYDRLARELANCPEMSPEIPYTLEETKEIKGYECIWPAEGNPYPLPNALLPFHRIVAYYGNFYSKNMGILGEYPPEVVLAKLREEAKKWEAADPDTPVIPAIDYIAVTAQASAGEDGDYNLRMPDDQIERALDMAEKVDGIVILEVQVGLSDLQKEIQLLEKFLKNPDVHLAIDPEFYMRRGNKPGKWIGTVTADDVNQAIAYLSSLVRENHLPPKVLLVHRFTKDMVQNAEAIQPTSEVQVVIVMDGWGSKELKKGTWYRVIEPEPVQFTGFKVFYKNDLKPPSTGLMTPEEILNLRPKPIYIQYQ